MIRPAAERRRRPVDSRASHGPMTTRGVSTHRRAIAPGTVGRSRRRSGLCLTVRRLRLRVADGSSSVAAIGTLGYVVLERWSVSDAAVHDVITLDDRRASRRSRALDEPGRVWTMILSIAAVGIIFGTVGIVAEGVLSEVASGRREARRMARAVAELRDHFIVCGYGRVGSTVARELVHGGQSVVVIDIRPESLEVARRRTAISSWPATARPTTVLTRGGRRSGARARDHDRLGRQQRLRDAVARALNPGLFIVGRASAPGAEAKVLQAGANRVVSPYTMAGHRIAELALRPRVVDFIDAALSHGELAFSMEEVEVGAGGPLDQRHGRRAAGRRHLHARDRPWPVPTTRTRPTSGSWPSARQLDRVRLRRDPAPVARARLRPG